MTCSRIDVANEVLASYTITQIEKIPRKGVYVFWSMGGKDYRRRWQCRGNDFYPVWNRVYPHGGTSVTSLSQLVRWVQDKPVLPVATWRYWANPKMNLLSNSVVDKLEEAGYPTVAKCVLCEIEITRTLDWWSLNGVSGPCCYYTQGCRQKA